MRVETRGSAAMTEHVFDYRIPDFAALRRTEFSRLDEGAPAYRAISPPVSSVRNRPSVRRVRGGIDDRPQPVREMRGS